MKTATRSKATWTEDEKNYLQDKWGSCSAKYIAKKLGRTEFSILNKAQKMKLGSRILADDSITFNELYNKGFDSYVIANILNKSQLSISDRIKALGG